MVISASRVTFWWTMFSSAMIALALMIVPLPQWLFYFWPDWIALIIIYWALYTPDRVGPVIGFVMGVLLEVLFVRKFGVEGFGLPSKPFVVQCSACASSDSP